MKTRFWLLLTFLLAISLAACQSAASPKPAKTEAPVATEAVTEAPAEVQQNPSEGQQPYPPQTEVQAQPGTLPTWDPSSPYPAPGDAEKVDWSKAEEIILSGDILKITQTKNLDVTIILKDSSMVITTEPVFDEVMRVKEKCGDKCSHVVMTTE